MRDLVSRRLVLGHLTGRYHVVPRTMLTGKGLRDVTQRHLELHTGRPLAVDHCYWPPTLVIPNLFAGLMLGGLMLFFVVPLMLIVGVIAGLVSDSLGIGLIWAAAVYLPAVAIHWAVSIREAARFTFTPPTTSEDRQLLDDLWAGELDLGYLEAWMGFQAFVWPWRNPAIYSPKKEPPCVGEGAGFGGWRALRAYEEYLPKREGGPGRGMER